MTYRRGTDDNLSLLGCYPFYALLFTDDTEQTICPIFQRHFLL